MGVSSSRTVLVTAPAFADAGLRLFRQAGCEVLVLSGTQDKDEVDSLLREREVHAIVSRTIVLDAAALQACGALRVISKHGAGVDNVDVAAATALGIPVTRTPGANATSVAELTLGLMLAAARRVAWLDREVRRGRWTRCQNGLQLSGRRLGVVGYGAVGFRVATLGRAIGMEVTVLDPALGASATVEGALVVDDLDQLLARSDVLSLHLPLTESTRHLVGVEQLAQLPVGAIVVNTARAGLLDEQALVSAICSGHVAAAGLDDLEGEPDIAGHPLLGLNEVVVTPHVGGSTLESLAAVGEAAARNAIDVLEGGVPARELQVNPEAFGSPRPGP